jgi:D-alanyl-D-alanine carboxypeptidase (penicillin-binding protein 5/6)
MVFMSVTFGSITAEAFNFTPVTGYDSDNNLVELSLNSEAAYMFNMDTGDVIVDINSDEERVPASLTKIMTAIVLLDEFGGDEDKLKSTKYSAGSEAFDELYGTGASTADIQPNEEVTCYDLLCALMLPSACEAANVIAIGISGSIEKFVDRMNEKAAELELNHTHFSNAHGLWGDDHYSSCADIAKMCTYALDTYPVFVDVVSMNDYTMSPTDYHPDGTYIYNTNSMLSSSSLYYYAACRGIKTGTLELAGRCLASYAVSDGKRYMIVTMGAPLEKSEEDEEKGEENPSSVYAADTVYYNIIDHINLYEWAFNWLEETEFVDSNSELCEAKVEYGEDSRDYVTLKPESDYKKYWPTYISTDEVEQEIEVYDNVVAPVYAGDQLGLLTLKYEDEVIAEIPLVATESVARSKTAEKAAVAKAFPHSAEFKAAVCLIIGFAVIFTLIHIVRVQRKYMKK